MINLNVNSYFFLKQVDQTTIEISMSCGFDGIATFDDEEKLADFSNKLHYKIQLMNETQVRAMNLVEFCEHYDFEVSLDGDDQGTKGPPYHVFEKIVFDSRKYQDGPICDYCGSKEIIKAFWCKWDYAKNEWKIDLISDPPTSENVFCQCCGTPSNSHSLGSSIQKKEKP